MTEIKNKTCGCCGGSAIENLTSGKMMAAETEDTSGMSRSKFLKTIAASALGLSTLAGINSAAASKGKAKNSIVKGEHGDMMIVDYENRELRISAVVTKDVTKPSVVDWGRRFQAFFGVWGGKMEGFFIFTTGVSRTDIDKAIQKIGVTSRRQIPMSEVEKRRGLKSTTTIEDYLDGDPVMVTIRFLKAGNVVETAIEDLIMEKIIVGGKDVIKPYTPHFIYHGTGEAINFPSGCVVCPSDCNGGIITDNVLPLKTTENYYKVNWERMPEVGTKVEVAIKSIYGPAPLSATQSEL